ncbi:DUF5914 domain-containing protein [Streptomyces sp. A1136]|uniref:DUF5914 domain-containing protein n=1 Tax=Streptomyces sp. A1136 TaxID=2563102 RepID=UPI00109E3FCC|nr:DUF5914 domain-containing protein [Streptomyces sp. A1136]THA51417.1 Rieske (2Fe-2S) protein [Streptomyces sp. A1136]
MTTRRTRRGRYPLSLRRAPVPWERQEPTWRAAAPRAIGASLERALARPSGNWYVLGASCDIGPEEPHGFTVAGEEIVAWRDGRGRLVAGSGICPHLGAPLAQARVHCGTLVCHWHGMALDGGPSAGWTAYPAHDDGVLCWVRLDAHGREEPLPLPVVARRPDLGHAVACVYEATGICEPEDIVANRLDPWHGAWFHPYSFVDLRVLETRGPSSTSSSSSSGDEALVVRVSFRLTDRIVIPVTAEFTAPEPRTVVMHITEGEGRGSVVETHATPLGAGRDGRPRTRVTEAVVAASERPGFAVARAGAALLRPLMRRTAARLWKDDLAYAERRWHLRSSGRFPG